MQNHIQHAAHPSNASSTMHAVIRNSWYSLH